MINSRSLDDLTPALKTLALKHIEGCKAQGIDLLIYCTYRDSACQASLYAQGRTAPGKIVTNARPGESFHEYRIAYDCVPLLNGKPVWDSSDPAWKIVGKVGEESGLEWAGRWRGKLKESAHFQLPGYSIADLKSGKVKVPRC